jgi:hypothetical protein
MGEDCEILVVVAGAAGSYFGWQMAGRGRSVVIVERSERQSVGTRLDVFHVDSVKFAEFGVPPPEEDSPEFCVVLEKGISYSPEGRFPKVVRYPFHVMRLPLFLQRLFGLAESEGVRFEFATAFVRLLYEGGRISRAVVERGEKRRFEPDWWWMLRGSARSSAPRCRQYGVESFSIAPEERFVVLAVHHLAGSSNRGRSTPRDGPSTRRGSPPPSTNAAPSSGSVRPAPTTTRRSLPRVRAAIPLPPHRVDKVERGVTPYRRPPTRWSGTVFSAWATAPA